MAQDEWLELTAKFSIISSVAIVIYFLAYAVIRISRMPNPLWKEWRTTKNRAVEVYKKPVELAYVLKLKDDATSASDYVTFHLKCNRKAEIKLLWGVSVPYLFDLMRCSWRDFQRMVTPDANLAGSSQHVRSARADACYAIANYDLPGCGDGFDDFITVSPPSHLRWEDLKNKYRYPLAVVVYRPEVQGCGDRNNNTFDGGSEIHGLFTIMHVKSSVFPMPTTVLAHYIKMDNGNTFLLKPLYLVEDDYCADEDLATCTSAASASDQSMSSTNENALSGRLPENSSKTTEFPGVLCSVCQSLPVSRAILPCGHVCLCVHCFEKVERCPICRGEMQFFFRTREEDPLQAAMFHQQELLELQRYRTWFDVFEDWGERLNAWFGVT